MWDVHSSKIRAYLRGQKRTSAAAAPTRAQPLRLKRSEAELVVTSPFFGAPARTIPARLLLNDMNPRGLFVFSREHLEVETDIALQISHLNNLHVRGKVFAANLYTLSQRVLTDRPLHYRLGIRFQFDNEDDFMDFQRFCKQMSEDFLRERA